MSSLIATLLLWAKAAVLGASSPASSLPRRAGHGARSLYPFPRTGAGRWHWVPINGTNCIGGQETGVWIRYSTSSSSRSVAISLDGGGACFNLVTCGTCAKASQPPAPKNKGIFAADDNRNPFKDFNWIHVPYCTGDVHIGHASKDFKGAYRHFSGHANLGLMMDRAVATFPVVDQLLITGQSAGGFGAISNYDFLRSHWTNSNGNSNIRAVLLDDSGPVLDDSAIPVCLQAAWRKAWNINASLPEGCPCIGNRGNLVSIWEFEKSKWPHDSFGLISSLADQTISRFFSFGERDCRRIIPGKYHGLEGGLRRLSQSGVPIYMIPGALHTHTGRDRFYRLAVNNTLLYKWVGQLMSDGPDPSSVSPSSVVASSVLVV